MVTRTPARRCAAPPSSMPGGVTPISTCVAPRASSRSPSSIAPHRQCRRSTWSSRNVENPWPWKCGLLPLPSARSRRPVPSTSASSRPSVRLTVRSPQRNCARCVRSARQPSTRDSWTSPAPAVSYAHPKDIAWPTPRSDARPPSPPHGSPVPVPDRSTVCGNRNREPHQNPCSDHHQKASACSVSLIWSSRSGSTRRTSGCGPACPVVWQGRPGNRAPYADREDSNVNCGLKSGTLLNWGAPQSP